MKRNLSIENHYETSENNRKTFSERERERERKPIYYRWDSGEMI